MVTAAACGFSENSTRLPPCGEPSPAGARQTGIKGGEVSGVGLKGGDRENKQDEQASETEDTGMGPVQGVPVGEPVEKETEQKEGGESITLERMFEFMRGMRGELGNLRGELGNLSGRFDKLEEDREVTEASVDETNEEQVMMDGEKQQDPGVTNDVEEEHREMTDDAEQEQMKQVGEPCGGGETSDDEDVEDEEEEEAKKTVTEDVMSGTEEVVVVVSEENKMEGSSVLVFVVVSEFSGGEQKKGCIDQQRGGGDENGGGGSSSSVDDSKRARMSATAVESRWCGDGGDAGRDVSLLDWGWWRIRRKKSGWQRSGWWRENIFLFFFK